MTKAEMTRMYALFIGMEKGWKPENALPLARLWVDELYRLCPDEVVGPATEKKEPPKKVFKATTKLPQGKGH